MLLLIAIIPGLYIYSRLRTQMDEKETDYIVLIQGIFFSMPLWAAIALFAFLRYPNQELFDSLKAMIYNYKYIILYFFVILIYSRLVILTLNFIDKKITPVLSKTKSRMTKKHAHRSAHNCAWNKIRDEYMMNYTCLVGRLLLNNEVIAFGQIGHISPSRKEIGKDILFLYQQEYTDYFPIGELPLLKHIGDYADLQKGYILELYDGNNQVRLKPKKS